jgi:sulfite reductase (NADPH) flavoprotein alpha-component
MFVSATDEKESKENEKLPAKHEDRYKIGYALPGRQVLLIYGTEYGFSEEVARYIFDR